MSDTQESGRSLSNNLTHEVRDEVTRLMEASRRDEGRIIELLMPYLVRYAAVSASRNKSTFQGAEGADGDYAECLSKAMDKAWKIIKSPNTRPEQFFHLLTRSLKNQMTDVSRKVNRTLRRFPYSIDDRNESGQAYAELTPAPQEIPTEHSEEMILILDAARQILNQDQFAIFELRLNNPSLNYTDIAKDTKEPAGTLKARVRRGTASLRDNTSFVELVEEHLRPSLSEITLASQYASR